MYIKAAYHYWICESEDLSGDFSQSFSGESYSPLSYVLKATAKEALVEMLSSSSIKAKPGRRLSVTRATIKHTLNDAEAETGAL